MFTLLSIFTGFGACLRVKCSLYKAFLLAFGACLRVKCPIYEAFLLAFGACLKVHFIKHFYWRLGHV